MAIFLDDQTRPYLERLLKNIKETDFIGARLQKMLLADRERLEIIGKCEHEIGHYIGKKYCCSKCGANYEVGMGESWSLEDQPTTEGSPTKAVEETHDLK